MVCVFLIRSRILPGLLFSLLLLLTACGPDFVYDNTQEVPEAGWTYDQPFRFNFQVQDTSKVYNLWLEVGHSAKFKNQNLYTKLYTLFPDGQKLEEVVSLELANNAGEWYGECSDEVCSLRVPLQTETYFDQQGEYLLTVVQHMRRDSLKGVHALRFTIEDTGETR